MVHVGTQCMHCILLNPWEEQQHQGAANPNPVGMLISPKAAWEQMLEAKLVFLSKPSCFSCLQGEEILLQEIPPSARFW